VKAPFLSPANVRPKLYRAPAPRSQATRIYQQQKLRQQRMVIVLLGTLAVLALVITGLWRLTQAIVPQIATIAAPTDTRDFERYMDREFGLYTTPSLLYYQNMNYALLRHPAPGLFKNKLMPIMPAKEDMALKAQLQQLFAQYPSDRFIPHFYFYNPQNNTSVEINGYAPVPAASVIKVPILLDYLMSLDENLITVDTPLLYAEFHRAGGAGELQYRDAGMNLMANDVAGQMIRISDNTCTNMMISYLGGTDAVNNRLAELGLVHTRIRNWLPDLGGTNTISPYEMVTIMHNIDHGPLISELARYNGIDILKSTHNRRLLVSSLPPEATVAHKTGDIGTAIGDTGIVYMPDGRKYFVSVQVERPYNDYAAREMVQRASRMIYDHVASQPMPGALVQAKLPASTSAAAAALQ
jgi:beta-lactamase class A